MNEVRVIYADLPPRIPGMLVKTFDEEDYYTVVLNSRLSVERQKETYEHEVKHITGKDFDVEDTEVDRIERIRHYDLAI